MFSLLLLLIGLWGLLIKRHLFKLAVSLLLIDYSLTLYQAANHFHINFFLSLISLFTTVVMVLLIISLHKKQYSMNLSQIRKLRG